MTRTVSVSEAAAAVAAHRGRGRPLWRGGGRAPVVALTFDDGPEEDGWRLLEALARGGAPATFFAIGNKALERPDLLRAQQAQGEVGNHTLDHPFLNRLSREAVRGALRCANERFSAAGVEDVRLYRPPYAERSRTTTAVAAELGLLEVMYSIDSDDWQRSDADAVVRGVLPGLRAGAILLLHEICPHTIDAVPGILAEIRRRGLRPVTVPELLALDPPRSRPVGRVQLGRDRLRMSGVRVRGDGASWDTRTMTVPDP
jgi:peptidoglycan/xylan/chitin deacetylase (PgdA/CDA1 family)